MMRRRQELTWDKEEILSFSPQIQHTDNVMHYLRRPGIMQQEQEKDFIDETPQIKAFPLKSTATTTTATQINQSTPPKKKNKKRRSRSVTPKLENINHHYQNQKLANKAPLPQQALQVQAFDSNVPQKEKEESKVNRILFNPSSKDKKSVSFQSTDSSIGTPDIIFHHHNETNCTPVIQRTEQNEEEEEQPSSLASLDLGGYFHEYQEEESDIFADPSFIDEPSSFNIRKSDSDSYENVLLSFDQNSELETAIHACTQSVTKPSKSESNRHAGIGSELESLTANKSAISFDSSNKAAIDYNISIVAEDDDDIFKQFDEHTHAITQQYRESTEGENLKSKDEDIQAFEEERHAITQYFRHVEPNTLDIDHDDQDTLPLHPFNPLVGNRSADITEEENYDEDDDFFGGYTQHVIAQTDKLEEQMNIEERQWEEPSEILDFASPTIKTNTEAPFQGFTLAKNLKNNEFIPLVASRESLKKAESVLNKETGSTNIPTKVDSSNVSSQFKSFNKKFKVTSIVEEESGKRIIGGFPNFKLGSQQSKPITLPGTNQINPSTSNMDNLGFSTAKGARLKAPVLKRKVSDILGLDSNGEISFTEDDMMQNKDADRTRIEFGGFQIAGKPMALASEKYTDVCKSASFSPATADSNGFEIAGTSMEPTSKKVINTLTTGSGFEIAGKPMAPPAKKYMDEWGSKNSSAAKTPSGFSIGGNPMALASKKFTEGCSSENPSDKTSLSAANVNGFTIAGKPMAPPAKKYVQEWSRKNTSDKTSLSVTANAGGFAFADKPMSPPANKYVEEWSNSSATANVSGFAIAGKPMAPPAKKYVEEWSSKNTSDKTSLSVTASAGGFASADKPMSPPVNKYVEEWSNNNFSATTPISSNGLENRNLSFITSPNKRKRASLPSTPKLPMAPKLGNSVTATFKLPSNPVSKLESKDMETPKLTKKPSLLLPSLSKTPSIPRSNNRRSSGNFIPLIVRDQKKLQSAVADTSTKKAVTLKSLFDMNELNDQIPLSDLKDERHNFSIEEMVQMNIPIEILYMTLDLAKLHTFKDHKGSTLGIPEATSKLIEAGANPKLATKRWVENHYTLIIWTLACYIRAFPKRYGSFGLVWSFENVVKRLRFRYEKEINMAKRACLKMIAERDRDASSTCIVLCIAKITETVNDDGNSVYRLLLTDGWYSIGAEVDEILNLAVTNGKLSIGDKLYICNAKLIGSEEGCSPLELKSSTVLKLVANSTRKAEWDASMGFRYDIHNFCLSIGNVNTFGGIIPKIDIVILRKYPVVVSERLENGKTIIRNLKDEELAENAYQKKYGQALQRAVSELEKERELEEKNQKYAKVTSLMYITDPEIIYQQLTLSSDQPGFMKALSHEQRNLLDSYSRKEIESTKREIQDEAVERAEEKCPKRKTTQMLKMLVCDAPSNSQIKAPLYPLAKGYLTFWRPDPDTCQRLKEGKRYQLSNVGCGQSRAVNGKYMIGVSLNANKGTNVSEIIVDHDTLVRDIPNLDRSFSTCKSICNLDDYEGDNISIIIGIGEVKYEFGEARIKIACVDDSEKVMIVEIRKPESIHVLDDYKKHRIIIFKNLRRYNGSDNIDFYTDQYTDVRFQGNGDTEKKFIDELKNWSKNSNDLLEAHEGQWEHL